MSFGKVAFFGSAALLAAACGGSAFSSGDGDGGAGGSSSSAGTSSSHAGKPSIAGSSSSGGASATGGRTGTGGSGIAGTVSMGGGPNCSGIDCAYPLCEDGAEPVTKPGECCPTCPPLQKGCEAVVCQPVTQCGEGYELKRPVGACCQGCVPKPGGVACTEQACPPDNLCPLGYVQGHLVGGCCYDCVPDPLFCNNVADCVTADRPRPCCGCPEAISRRMYDADACWSDVTEPRMIPQDCYPQQICDAVCGVCAPPTELLCGANHRCALAPLGPQPQ